MPRRASLATLALLAATSGCARADDAPPPPATVPRRLFALPISPQGFIFQDGDVSPDGRSFAFVEFWQNGDHVIRIADVATGESRLLVGGPGRRKGVGWSPDGREIAYASPDGVAAADAASGAARWLWAAEALEPAWTQWRRDGRIAFVGKDAIQIRGEPESPLYPMQVPANRGEAAPVELGVELMDPPSYAPRGERAALFLEESEGTTLWVMEMATGEARCVAEGLAVRGAPAVWSPDGEELYFLAMPGPGSAEYAYAARLREGGARRLEIGPWVHDVSVDGRGNLFLVSAADAGYHEDALWIYPRPAVERAMTRPLDIPACRRPPHRLHR